MQKKINAPISGRKTFRWLISKGLNGLIVLFFIFESGCNAQPASQPDIIPTGSPTSLPTPTASSTPTQTVLSQPSPTFTETQIPSTATPARDLQAELDTLMEGFPTGRWGVYIENINTGQTASFQAKDILHPASTVKIYLSVALLYWLDQNPSVALTDKPKWEKNYSYHEILQASLGGTDEILTGEIYTFLNSQPGFNPFTLAKEWGAERTMFGPRQSTPADLGLLLKKLYQKEILSDASREIFFKILQSSDRKTTPLLDGIPVPEQKYLFEKNSMVFTESLNIMATTALYARSDCAYTVTIVANKVEPLLKDKASALITNISNAAFYSYCGLPVGEVLPSPTPAPTNTATSEATSTPTLTFTPLPPTPTETITPTLKVTLTPTLDTPFTRDVNRLLEQIPSNSKGLYIKNFRTGELVSLRGNDVFHIASTIKVFVGVSFFAWLDKYPQVSLIDTPDWDSRNYMDLLYAMLVESDEGVTAGFYNMLSNYQGFNPYNLTKSWGAVHTDIGNRQSTPADVALIFEKLDKNEILTDQSRQRLLNIMRTNSPDRDLPALVKGVPVDQRQYFADKNGLVFEDELNVIADAGYFVNDTCAYTLVIVTNKIDPANKLKINEIITDLSGITYKNFCQ